MADDREYITVAEASMRIHYSRQSLYNMISSQKFVLGLHYVKPTRKKVLFIWPALMAWVERREEPANSKACAPKYRLGR